MGGKTRIAKDLARVMLRATPEREVYLEPFLGAGSVAAQMAPEFKTVLLNDASPDLIALWRALQDGWKPPATVSEDEYNAQRTAPVSALRGFVGYGCSFGGKWFGGFARDPRKPWSFAQTAINGLGKKITALQNASFFNLDYRLIPVAPGSVIYCDPPYRGVTAYARLDEFDSGEFWATVSKWSDTSAVFVSEYTAPVGWVSVWQGTPKMTLQRGDNVSTATEHLWIRE
jgi:DNA adenine methylase